MDSPPQALLRRWARCKLLSNANRTLDRTMTSFQRMRSRTTPSKDSAHEIASLASSLGGASAN